MAADWTNEYERRKTGADEAVAALRPGSRIYVSGGCAAPRSLINALVRRASSLPDTEIIGMFNAEKPAYAEERYAESFRINAFSIDESVRDLVLKGLADYTPVLISEAPALFRGGRMRLEAALVHVSPPDAWGYCSLGVGVDLAMAALDTAAYVVAQVNPRMPRTHGDTFVHVSRLHAIVEHEEELPLPGFGVCGDECRTIGKLVSSLIEDGSTLHVGMGVIPENVLLQLGDHRDLGVHTEVVSTTIMEMVKKGVITNARKTLHRGKVIASSCMGTRELYDFVHDNPMFEFHPADYTNNRNVIATNDKMVSINTAMRIDLTGQVGADLSGSQGYGGLGGLADFIRGAAMSKGGKPIIVLPSTTGGASPESAIVPGIAEGAGVETTRHDVHYVVTEFGIAYLHGKSIRDRALGLVEIAHPMFREWLLDEAKKLNFVYRDQTLRKGAVYPSQYVHWHEFAGGLKVFFRPVRATDEGRLQRLIYRMSQESRYLRFFENLARFPHRRAQELATVDYAEDMALVGIVKTDSGEELIAAGHYMKLPRSSMAETAFMVDDRYQGKKIGQYLLKYLIKIARENGIEGFIADVLLQNKSMLKVFLNSGFEVRINETGGEYRVTFTFDKPIQPKS